MTAARPRPPPPRPSFSSTPTASRCRERKRSLAGSRSACRACSRRSSSLHDKYGKLPWAELFQPAIALARDGFPVSPRLAKMLAEADPETFTPEARAYFFDDAERPWPAGYKLTNPALAETFDTIARDGPRAPSMRARSPATLLARCRTIRAGPAGSPPRISPTTAPRSASRSACSIAIIVCAAWVRPPRAPSPSARCLA